MKNLKEFICESSNDWADIIHALKTKWGQGCNIDWWCDSVLRVDRFQYKDPENGQLGDLQEITYVPGDDNHISMAYLRRHPSGCWLAKFTKIDENTLLDILNRKYDANSKDRNKGKKYFKALVEYIKKG